MAAQSCMEWILIKKINKQNKNGDKDAKAMYKLKNNAIYGKIMGNVRNRIHVRLVNIEKDYLKYTTKTNLYVA